MRKTGRVWVAGALSALFAGAPHGLGAPGADAPPHHASAGTILVVGTNSPGDAAAINAAIAGSPAGSEIVLRGSFLIDQTIRLLGERSYRGESRTGTVLKQAEGANLTALMASSVFLDNTDYTGTPLAVRHLTLDGNRAKNPDSATAGLVLRSWLSVVEDVYIRAMGGDGLRVTNLSANGTGLKTTQVNGRISACFIEKCARHGIFAEDTQNAVTDWILTDTWIADSGGDAIHLDNAAGWVVERNHIYGVGGNALYAHRLFGSSIADNYIEGFGEGPQAGVWHGILVTLQGGVASTIAGNRVFNFAGERNPESVYKYLAVSVNYGTGAASVTGNVIRGAGTPAGIGLHYSAKEGTAAEIVSTGNNVVAVGQPRVVGDRVTLSTGL